MSHTAETVRWVGVESSDVKFQANVIVFPFAILK